MTDEKWEQLVDVAQKNFRNVEVLTEDLLVANMDGQQVQGTRDVLMFDSPAGRFRLERENRPAVLEKKMHYSHRQGDTAQTEYKFSDTEFSHKLKVLREGVAEDWEEVSLSDLGL